MRLKRKSSMYHVEFRVGNPVSSEFLDKKWVPVVPQRKDIVRLGGKMYTVEHRYIGVDDHIVLFIKRDPGISGDKHWKYPLSRRYAREDK
jgi:hypothetical protein